ncbi:Ferrous-iron efflux pump FieF [uncultured archaeon]|nr:Ferrous-iron efflux pump FieF [uncultured archaeon]
MMPQMQDDRETIDNRKASAARLSVISNSTLVVLKLAVGIAIGSVSVISEAIHSGVDLLAAVIAWFAVKTSSKPADEDHPFGHGKVENISGTVEALLIFIAACGIIIDAAKKLINPQALEAPGLGVAVMLVSSVANIMISRMLFRVGKETDSVALQADAWHLRTDVYTSAGVTVALLIIWSGGVLFPEADLKLVDPLVAIVVALLIIKAAYKLTVESTRGLMDVSLPPEEEEKIRKCISAFAPTVRGVHRLRTRKSGSYRFVEFHARVDASMSISESHRITDMISLSIKECLPNTVVTIHIEPCDCTLATDESCGCQLSEDELKAIRAKPEDNME